MNGKVQHRPCPRCGGTAETKPGQDLTHGAFHGLQHGMKHHSPILIGIGLAFGAVQLFKKFRYYCRACGKEFFST